MTEREDFAEICKASHDAGLYTKIATNGWFLESNPEFAKYTDLSFISLTKVLENLKNLLSQDFHEMICLIKPQFEAGKEKIEKGGVVRSKDTHNEVITNVLNFATSIGYHIKGLTYSSIKGPSGNIEYLVWLSTQDENIPYPNIKTTIDDAFLNLNN